MRQRIAELVVTHLAVLPGIEMPHELQHILPPPSFRPSPTTSRLRRQLEAELLQGLTEFPQRQDLGKAWLHEGS